MVKGSFIESKVVKGRFVESEVVKGRFVESEMVKGRFVKFEFCWNGFLFVRENSMACYVGIKVFFLTFSRLSRSVWVSV
jgi:hypothetical protein